MRPEFWGTTSLIPFSYSFRYYHPLYEVPTSNTSDNFMASRIHPYQSVLNDRPQFTENSEHYESLLWRSHQASASHITPSPLSSSGSEEVSRQKSSKKAFFIQFYE